MFDLEQHIQNWRQQLLQHESVEPTEIRELESHLRETVDELLAIVEPNEAFLLATRRVGSPDAIALEFSKINGARTWTRRTQWMLVGYLAISLGLGLIGTFSKGAVWFATYLGAPIWIAGAFSSLGIIVGVMTLMYFTWSVTYGNALGMQTIASRFANHAKSGHRWRLVAAVLSVVLSVVIAKSGLTMFASQFLPPEQFAISSILSSMTNWTGSLIVFGTIAALLCWLINQDGDSTRQSPSRMLIAAALVAVLLVVTYGLVIAGLPYVYGPAFSA